MFKNYFKIALRNLSKHKGYTLINTAGLAIGMGICLFLVLLTQYAINMDRYHENSERIYLLSDAITQNNGDILDVAISPGPWGPKLKEEYSEIEEIVRFYLSSGNVRYEDKILRQGINYVDEGIFDVFSYAFKYGDPKGALKRPNTIVLSEDMSIRYFANENPVGKYLTIDDNEFEITGVLEKFNPRSSFRFNSLASFKSLDATTYSYINDWRSHNLYTYLLLEENAPIDVLTSRFPDFIERNVGEEYVQRYSIHLEPFEDLFLFSSLYSMHGDSLDISYIYIFGAIGFLILFIACINFINLATAQGIKRAREIGVRKVLGAYKKQLIFQFISEALIVAGIAVLLSVVFVELALPWFNDIAEWSVSANYFSNTLYLSSIVGIVLLVGILAGSYPAFFMSAFSPVKVLKGTPDSNNGTSWLKTGLVITQFSVAIFLIISTASVENQLSFIKGKDLGIETKDMLITSVPKDDTPQNIETVRAELFKVPGVQEVSFSSNIPGEESGNRDQYYPEGNFESTGLLVNTYSVDSYFATQFGLKFTKGRDFSPEINSDTLNSVVINQKAAEKFGWSDPIGKTISIKSSDENTQFLEVIGVVEDFHYETLHTGIQPLILKSDPKVFDNVSIKIRSANIGLVTDQAKDVLKYFNNNIPVWNYFLEEDIQDEYSTETVISEMLRYFTLLTMFIACLGLLGLISFTIINRKKEIGIRKILGAPVVVLVQSLSIHFIKLVFIGFIIGAPLAYLLINEWLKSFAYRVTPSIWIFVGAGILTLLISILTIGYQTIKAALANPVDSLHSD